MGGGGSKTESESVDQTGPHCELPSPAGQELGGPRVFLLSSDQYQCPVCPVCLHWKGQQFSILLCQLDANWWSLNSF